MDNFTFVIFSVVFSTSKKKLKKGIKEQGKGDDQAVEVRLSAFTYKCACSEISHLYHDSGKNKEATSTQLWSKLYSYNKGSRRIS